MKITDEIVRKIASLSAIGISEEEIPKIKEKLTHVLSYVEQLNEVDVSGVEEFNPIDRKNLFREDRVTHELTPETLLENAPEHDDRCFKIPRIL